MHTVGPNELGSPVGAKVNNLFSAQANLGQVPTLAQQRSQDPIRNPVRQIQSNPFRDTEGIDPLNSAKINSAQIKQLAKRRFCDGDNGENLYIMENGSMYVENLRAGKFSKVSTVMDLLNPTHKEEPEKRDESMDVDQPTPQQQE